MEKSKLFIFAIGGTGVRVLRSFLMLLASGAELRNTREVIPIVIDTDLSNGNWLVTRNVLELYKKIQDEIKNLQDSEFFKTKISTLNDYVRSNSDRTKEHFKIQIDGTENVEFQKFIDYPNLDQTNKALVDLLFSKENLNIKMNEGFYGNPNIGSVVFTQLKESREFKSFLGSFAKGDKIFFISSLFGGTGASGFPTLVKLIRNEQNLNVKEAKLGSLSLLPYYGLTEGEKINSDVFLTKTKAALEYIKTLDVNAKYFIGDDYSRTICKYQNFPGATKQYNYAHYVELCGALSIFHFMEQEDSQLTSNTNYYFGIFNSEKNKPIRFENFSQESYQYLKNLAKYFYFTVYSSNQLSNDIEKASWSKDSKFGGALDKNFFQGKFYTQIEQFNHEFLLWLTELAKSQRSLEFFSLGFSDLSLLNEKEVNIKAILGTLKKLKKDNILEVSGLSTKKKNLLASVFTSDPISQYTEFLNKESKNLENKGGISTQAEKFIYLFSKATHNWIQENFNEFDIIKSLSTKPEILNYHLPGQIKTGWFSIIGDIESKDIEEPDLMKVFQEITSVPSPFARIQLFDTAFYYVQKSQEGQTPYHKLVSECFDVWITVFNQAHFPNEIRIIEWAKGSETEPGDLQKLLKSSNPKHKLLGQAFKLFLEQEPFFKDWTSFFIVIDKNEVIGGTSPLTVFFSSANPKQVHRMFGDDTTFDDQYCPILKRSSDFVDYIYRFREYLKEENPYIANFEKLTSYLDSNHYTGEIQNEKGENQYHNSSLYEELKAVSGKPILLYPSSKYLLLKRKKLGAIEIKSDFFIQPTKTVVETPIPMVLGEYYASKPMKYVGANWNENTVVPYYDPNPIGERRLPEQNIQYPYYTISDFLEPYLFELDYPISEEYYYSPAGLGSEENGYLLPLKPLFFKYFSAADLISGSLEKDQKNFISIRKTAGGGAEVTLRIPIQKREYIEYKRLYTERQEPDETKNEGVLKKAKLSVNISPPLKGTPNPHYRVMLINVEDNAKRKYKLNFYNENLKPLEKVYRSIRTDAPGEVITEYYALEEEFSIIQVESTSPNAHSILLPKFKEYKTRGKKYYFAVDFGTANTHIEFREENGKEEEFSISQSDFQVATLHRKGAILANKEYHYYLNVEFFPEFIGRGQKYSFPTRTVLSEKLNINYSLKESLGLVVSNIPLGYGRERMLASDRAELIKNLKWIKDTSSKEKEKFKERIRLFFEELIFLIRNKVLLNGGDLSQTELVWFYPYSMDPYVRDNYLHPIWNELFQTYIHPHGETKFYSESIAPYYYYLDRNDVQGAVVVSVDIGGGTTDVAIYKEKSPLFLCSFRFASNSLYGDGFGKGNIEKNGFLIKHKKDILNKLQETNLDELKKTIEHSLQTTRESSEIISIFFGIENASEVKEKGVKISFAEILQEDTQLKIVFLLYYSAILYHITKIIKQLNIELPKNIIFTGMGSKVLNLITRSDAILEEYTKTFIEKIAEKKYEGRKFTIIQNKDNPKEATSKGGLCMNEKNVPSDIDNFKGVLLGSKEDIIITSENQFFYGDLTEEHIQNVKEEFKFFVQKFLEIGEREFFEKKFGINDPKVIQICRDILLNDAEIIDQIKEGLSRIKSEIGNPENKTLVETLFFYPLKGLINDLAYEIAIKE